MDPGFDGRRMRSFFPFDRLPIEVQYRILALLPITTLVVCKAVSPSWRSIIRSSDFIDSYPRHLSRRRDDIFFLFFSCSEDQTYFPAYLPTRDRWICFPLPRLFGTSQTSGTSLLLHKSRPGQYCVVNPFAPHTKPHILPRPLNFGGSRKPLAFIQNSSSDYRIIMVSTSSHRLYFQIFHSRTGQWESCGQLDRVFIVLWGAVYLDGTLFCVTSSTNHIVTFDLATEVWTILDLELPLPKLFCYRLLVFGGEIYLAGGVSKEPRIGIWELDRSAMTWREVSFMPAEYINQFIGEFSAFGMVSCMGIICFYTTYPRKFVMCDLTGRRWWWPGPCDVSEDERMWQDDRMWLGHAIEPYIELLK